MLFFSPFSGYRVTGIRNETVQYHPVTGYEIGRTAALRAEFGQSFGPEYEFKDPVTGEVSKAADIRGNYFDTEAAQELLKWADADREEVERVLLNLCSRRPDQIKHVPILEPVIMAPWPTYAQADADQAIALAKELGLVREALAYEVTQENRQFVIEAFEDEIATWVTSEGEPLEVAVAPLKNEVQPEKPVLKPKRGGEPADPTGTHPVPGVITV